jgi:hypothetical protein
MFAVGGGQEGEAEEHFLPSEGGSLGGGPFPCFGGRLRLAGSRLPRSLNSDSVPSSSSSSSQGWRTSASTSGVSGGFWEKHGARWRAEERRFGASAQVCLQAVLEYLKPGTKILKEQLHVQKVRALKY